MLSEQPRIAVLVSGGGTNLQALLDAQGTTLRSGEIVLVISNNPGASALERAGFDVLDATALPGRSAPLGITLRAGVWTPELAERAAARQIGRAHV